MESLEATLERGEPMELVVDGEAFRLDLPETLQVPTDAKDDDSPGMNLKGERQETDTR